MKQMTPETLRKLELIRQANELNRIQYLRGKYEECKNAQMKECLHKMISNLEAKHKEVNIPNEKWFRFIKK